MVGPGLGCGAAVGPAFCPIQRPDGRAKTGAGRRAGHDPATDDRPRSEAIASAYTHDVAGYETPEFHPAFEEYCETIFELAEDDVDVIQARIAERLDVSRPAVSEMIRRMEANGLVDLTRGVRLTADGRDLGERVVRRHRLAERFLTDILGLSWTEAHTEAGKWEHVISDSVEVAMARVLGEPTTCPHGNPIPGSAYAEPSEIQPLSDIGVGVEFMVRRITEELEFTPGLLEFLEDSAIVPGRHGQVTASSPDGAITVEIDGRHIGVGEFAGTRILVTVA
jgi:DtxR family Mn-dependent transcriptional regulator